MINHENAFIGIHIPKTGGTSIIKALKQTNVISDERYRINGKVSGYNDHANLKEVCDELGNEMFEKYYKFSVVRNPWERVGSWYINYFKEVMNFKSFVMDMPSMIENNMNPLTNKPQSGTLDFEYISLFRSQQDWLSIDGKIIMDKIIRFENLEKEFYQLPFKKTNIKLPHLKKQTLVNNYKDLYDQQMVDVVSDVYKKDIETFNFKF